MKLLLGVAALFIVIIIGNTVIVAQETMKAPVAKKVPKGFEDPWLRDHGQLRVAPRPQQGKGPGIIKYLEDENAYTETFMGKHQPFVDALYKEMLGRIKQDDTSVPYKLGDYWYFNKTEEGKQYPRISAARSKDLQRPRGAARPERDGERASSILRSAIFLSRDDGNLLAYATDTTGYRQYTLQIKNLRTGETLPDKIERVTSVEWSNDGKYLFVGQEDPVSKRSDKFFGTRSGRTRNDLSLRKRTIFSTSASAVRATTRCCSSQSVAKTMHEYRYLAGRQPDRRMETDRLRVAKDTSTTADYDNGEFYIVTNKDGAENFKVMKAPASDPTEKNWTDFIPYNATVKIDGIDFFKDYAVVVRKGERPRVSSGDGPKTQRAVGSHRDARECLHDGCREQSRIRHAVSFAITIRR